MPKIENIREELYLWYNYGFGERDTHSAYAILDAGGKVVLHEGGGSPCYAGCYRVFREKHLQGGWIVLPTILDEHKENPLSHEYIKLMRKWFPFIRRVNSIPLSRMMAIPLDVGAVEGVSAMMLVRALREGGVFEWQRHSDKSLKGEEFAKFLYAYHFSRGMRQGVVSSNVPRSHGLWMKSHCYTFNDFLSGDTWYDKRRGAVSDCFFLHEVDNMYVVKSVFGEKRVGYEWLKSCDLPKVDFWGDAAVKASAKKIMEKIGVSS